MSDIIEYDGKIFYLDNRASALAFLQALHCFSSRDLELLTQLILTDYDSLLSQLENYKKAFKVISEQIKINPSIRGSWDRQIENIINGNEINNG